MSATYHARRAWLEEYFDRTAARAWATLTSQAPVGRIRASVRAGRDQMRALLLSWLPHDLRGQRVLDAGCGTGALAADLAQRGASVVAVDLSPTLVALAAERLPAALRTRVEFKAGDMSDASLGAFDYTVAMDSLIHYAAHDFTNIIAAFAPRTRRAVLFTFAPRTPLLATMHALGSLFPRGNRAPSIEPIADRRLLRSLRDDARFTGLNVADTQRVHRGFYISQGVHLVRRTADGGPR